MPEGFDVEARALVAERLRIAHDDERRENPMHPPCAEDVSHKKRSAQ